MLPSPQIDGAVVYLSFADEAAALAFLRPYVRLAERLQGTSHPIALPFPNPDISFDRPRVCFEIPWLSHESASLIRLTELTPGMLSQERCEVTIRQLADALQDAEVADPALLVHPAGTFVNTTTGDTYHFIVSSMPPAGLGSPGRSRQGWLLQEVIQRHIAPNVRGFSPARWSAKTLQHPLLAGLSIMRSQNHQAPPPAPPRPSPLVVPGPTTPRIQSSRVPAALLVLLLLSVGVAATVWTVLLQHREQEQETTRLTAEVPPLEPWYPEDEEDLFVDEEELSDPEPEAAQDRPTPLNKTRRQTTHTPRPDSTPKPANEPESGENEPESERPARVTRVIGGERPHGVGLSGGNTIVITRPNQGRAAPTTER